MDQSPKRINQSVLSAAERRLLDLLVRKMPPAVTSHHLTAFGLLGGLVAGAGYVLSAVTPAFLWLSVLGIVMHWFGDSLDGSLARYRRTPSRAGTFADHTVDVLAELFVLLGLGFSPYVRLDVALAALVGYYMMTILGLARGVVEDVFRITYAGLGPTEVRLALIALTFAMMLTGADPVFVFGTSATIYDGFLLAFAVGLACLFVISLLTTFRRLSRR